MAEPSPKRRKTSSTALRPVDASALNNISQTPTRASFMSPTKASLSRFNPELLPRPGSASSAASRPNSRGELLARGRQVRAYILGNGEPAAQTQSEVNDQSTGGAPAEAEEREETAREAPAENGIPAEVVRTRELEPASSSTAQPLASAIRPGEDEEDDLPFTPSKRLLQELASDPPPRGILYSTPSKRARRNKALAGKSTPSPLKSVDRPATELSNQPQTGAQEPLNEDGVEAQQPGDVQTRHSPKPAVDEAQRAKQREKDDLLMQLRDLESDIKRFEHHLAKGRSLPQDAAYDDLGDLISLLASDPSDNKTSNDDQNPIPISQILSSFLPFSKPPPLRPPTPPTSPKPAIPSHQPVELDDPLPYLRLFTPLTVTSTIELPPGSTTPLPTNPSTPPSLSQLHTIHIRSPTSLLTMTLNLTIATHSSDALAPTVAAVSISGLPPWAEYELGNWLRDRAAERDVGTMCWALGSYWDVSVKRATCWARCEDRFSHLLGGSSAGVEDAVVDDDGKAARDGVLGRHAQAQRRNRTRQIPDNTGEDGSHEGQEEEEEEEEEEVSGIIEPSPPNQATTTPSRPAKSARTSLSRETLLRHLGRDVLVFRDRHVLLRVEWKVQFDWTGETESVVGARAWFPRVWHEADDRKSLGKVSTLFDGLVRERGVFGAVEVVVGLLFA